MTDSRERKRRLEAAKRELESAEREVRVDPIVLEARLQEALNRIVALEKLIETRVAKQEQLEDLVARFSLDKLEQRIVKLEERGGDLDRGRQTDHMIEGDHAHRIAALELRIPNTDQLEAISDRVAAVEGKQVGLERDLENLTFRHNRRG